MVARLVRDQEAVGSNPATSTMAVAPLGVATRKGMHKAHPFLIASNLVATFSLCCRTVRNDIAFRCRFTYPALCLGRIPPSAERSERHEHCTMRVLRPIGPSAESVMAQLRVIFMSSGLLKFSSLLFVRECDSIIALVFYL